METLWIIIILSSIGLVAGFIIFLVNRYLPREPESLKKAERISGNLPGYNCGACGYPGCFSYAQAVAKDNGVINSNPCTTVMQDEGMLAGLEKEIGIKIDTLNKKAVIHCFGVAEPLGDYEGIKTCESANNIIGGFKRCPYGCLGLGDCMAVCPQDAIKIDEKRKIAVIDPDRCTGCGLCISECPKNIISLVDADANIVFRCNYNLLKDIPGREKCDEGCLHCRKCFKACEHEAITWNKEKGIPEFDFTKCTMCGKCINACPHGRLVEFCDVCPKKQKEAAVKV